MELEKCAVLLGCPPILLGQIMYGDTPFEEGNILRYLFLARRVFKAFKTSSTHQTQRHNERRMKARYSTHRSLNAALQAARRLHLERALRKCFVALSYEAWPRRKAFAALHRRKMWALSSSLLRSRLLAGVRDCYCAWVWGAGLVTRAPPGLASRTSLLGVNAM